jgi:hypothetical protein
MTCSTYLHLKRTEGKKPVKRSCNGSLVGILSTRDDNQEKLSQQTLECSSVVTSASTTATWRRPRSVTNIIVMRSRAGRNDDKLSPQNEERQSKAPAFYEEDITPSASESSDSCGQEWDLTMHAHQVRRNDDARSENKNNNRCLVTPDLATAWVQMASQDSKTDCKSETTTTTAKTTATATTATPITLHVAHRSAMVPNELDDEDAASDTTS